MKCLNESAKTVVASALEVFDSLLAEKSVVAGIAKVLATYLPTVN